MTSVCRILPRNFPQTAHVPPCHQHLWNVKNHALSPFPRTLNQSSFLIDSSNVSLISSNDSRFKYSGKPFRCTVSVRAGLQEGLNNLPGMLMDSFSLFPPTWSSSLITTTVVFALGSPILLSGLTLSGMAAAYILGLLTWRAFGFPGFIIVCIYFILGTAVTKVRIKQKEAEGIAEKRKGRRGPGSVWGSGTAGILCALAAISSLGQNPEFFKLLQLGFIASFCTKLGDTSSSEIGKAFGRTTYLITTFEKVPRGTEGAVSIEGTAAGFLASCLLASIAVINQQIDPFEASICVFSSQLANYAESLLGATVQDKEGFQWLTNDMVNVLNITLGAAAAIVLKAVI